MSAPSATSPPSLARPTGSDLALMAVGVLGVSTSGPLIAATLAPALAIAFWRNALATAVMLPYALLRGRADLARLRGRELRLTLAAGALLAAHFATWVPSLRYTSVASSTALVCMQAVWAALFARLAGERVPGRAWLGMALALLGVLLVTGVDAAFSARALVGDVLALAGGIFSGAYVVLGAQVRRSVSTTAYTTACYGTCALLLLALCVLSGQALTGYSADAWARIAALTVLAQLLGHSVFNLVLRTTSPTVVSLVILFEVPGAAVLAALALDDRPPAAALPALALLLAGIAVVIRSREQLPAVVPD
ncbi:MAG: DMT family transporter [Actinomycetota bacterium]|nr:DMT family transporter [Actinomycetota bacterium]